MVLVVNVLMSITFSFQTLIIRKIKQAVMKKRVTLQITLNKYFEGDNFDISM